MRIIKYKIILVLLLILALSPISFAQNKETTVHRRTVNWDYYLKDRPIDSIPKGNTVGCIAPEIKLKDFNNKEYSTDDLKGKLVLIHFWSSNCLHCRKYNKNLVKNYNDYKDAEFYNGNGFEVFSVSLDIKNEEWKLAIKQDGLIWPYHVNDHKGWLTDLKTKFSFSKTPTTFLIDKDGVIIAKNVIGASLDRRLRFFLKGTE
ncbi:MAG: TlpA disulfide reductase family protein [Bacteroidota bacterium]|nr:TlpA disulfide reductase family protein [Bacteroidota bacterium]